MKLKVYIAYPIPESVENFIAQHCEIHKWDGNGRVPTNILIEEIAEVEGLYTSGSMTGPINEELLSHASQLKVVSNVSVGYNNFNLAAMTKHNVIGTNTPNVLNETVADLAFGLLLATARRIPELDRFVKEGNWEHKTNYVDLYGKDVHGTTLGIIGMGRIGEAIAKRAKFGFDMNIIYHNRNRNADAEKKYDAEYCDLDALLRKSDYVLLMTPLTKDTFHLIGEEEFKLMKETAIFINVSRGQTVDEQALIRALENKKILGAGLDVFEKEPVAPDNPLLKLPNVVTVPHIGSATAKTEEAMAMRAAENLVAVLTGKGPIDPVVN
ncbi:2-hydroxyacid dehydrogenase [Sporosarcina jiandibaonis]|uniref:2-hydroxyacid dehydrogenase n=1 Tax=Sporosarcina jiandibaonis TaxID=2715535 RepID=UPI0015567592|nr:D-glycerate dehydrogenase [Sporosarcina jiandibaonis]